MTAHEMRHLIIYSTPVITIK